MNMGKPKKSASRKSRWKRLPTEESEKRYAIIFRLEEIVDMIGWLDKWEFLHLSVGILGQNVPLVHVNRKELTDEKIYIAMTNNGKLNTRKR